MNLPVSIQRRAAWVAIKLLLLKLIVTRSVAELWLNIRELRRHDVPLQKRVVAKLDVIKSISRAGVEIFRELVVHEWACLIRRCVKIGQIVLPSQICSSLNA